MQVKYRFWSHVEEQVENAEIRQETMTCLENLIVRLTISFLIQIYGRALIAISQLNILAQIEQFTHLTGYLEIIVEERIPFLFEERRNVISIILEERR